MQPGQSLADILGILELGQRLELAMAELYLVLERVHRESTSIAALWRKTAREETQHAAQYRLAMGSANAMISGVSADWSAAQAMVQEITTLAQRYASDPPPISAALESAIRLEESLAHLHLDRACRFTKPAHQRLFRAMMAADQEHVESLRAALSRFRA